MHPFFDFFNKDRPFIDSNPAKWPTGWKTINFKAYPRYPRINLPSPSFRKQVSLSEALLKRKSRRDFRKKQPNIREISNLLFFSCGLIKKGKNPIYGSRRVQPSGGALFPLEIYPIVFHGGKEVPIGIYHYNVLEHCLEKLPARNMESLKHAFRYPWVKNASLVLVFSFTESRNKPKYGNLAYKVGLLEAGHISQNVYLASAAMGLKCCALGGLNEAVVHKTLDLDGVSEAAFYAIAVGK